jgi:hypothetical protein
MLTLEITNLLTEQNEYSYIVKVNSKTISCGKVSGHSRDDGWKALVRKVVDEAKTIGADVWGPCLEFALAPIRARHPHLCYNLVSPIRR